MHRRWKLAVGLLVGAALLIAGHFGSNRLLVSAAKHGHASRVRLALALGANPNAWDRSREQPPLTYAAFSGNLQIVRLLLDHGAAVSAVSQHGVTPLHAAAEEGHVEVVRLLLERGARVDVVDYGWRTTPLGSVFESGQTPAQRLAIVRLLVERGADPNITWGPNDVPGSEYYPLDWAEEMGERDLATYLRAHGAKHAPRRPKTR